MGGRLACIAPAHDHSLGSASWFSVLQDKSPEFPTGHREEGRRRTPTAPELHGPAVRDIAANPDSLSPWTPRRGDGGAGAALSHGA